jgi:hypothetical protein
MVGDRMYCFSLSGVSYSDRSSHFTIWKTIEFPFKFKGGNANWDINNIDKGVVSMVIQYSPTEYGNPTPIEIFNIKFSE